MDAARIRFKLTESISILVRDDALYTITQMPDGPDVTWTINMSEKYRIVWSSVLRDSGLATAGIDKVAKEIEWFRVESTKSMPANWSTAGLIAAVHDQNRERIFFVSFPG